MVNELLSKFISNKKCLLPAEFLVKMVFVYAAWRTFKYGGEHYENFLWGGWDWIKNLQGNLIAYCSANLLRLLGYSVEQFQRMIMVDGNTGIYVADLCLGIAPMVIFTGFVLAFGNNNRNKIWFVPLGLGFIFIINVFRTMALVLVQVHYNKYFKFAHENLYFYITYGAIFLLLMWWMNTLAFVPKDRSTT